MVKERQDITVSSRLKGVRGSDSRRKGINDSWKEYMEQHMNEQNEWDHRISAGVNKGSADCTRIDEVAATLKKIKRHKAPGMSGPVEEMIQATGDIGTQWILETNLQKERGSNGVWIVQRN